MHIVTRSTSVAAVLLATSLVAQAADLPPAPPRPAPPPPPATAPVMVPMFSWTGFYIGGNIGGAWLQGDLSTDEGTSWKRGNAQFIGGGQLGFNYQFGAFVAGLESDFDFTTGSKETPYVQVLNGPLVHAVGKWDWMVTVAARLGVAFDRTLLFGKIGYGWSRTSVDLEDAGGTVYCCGWGNTNSGLLLGGGIEYAFTNHWTGKIEYNYIALRARHFDTTSTPISSLGTVTVNPDVQMVKAGFNYKF